jgi:hypothetical protein
VPTWLQALIRDVVREIIHDVLVTHGVIPAAPPSPPGPQ